jgi:hypothetical protein
MIDHHQAHRVRMLCVPCQFEMELLRSASGFPLENIEMYEDRYGILDGRECSWIEVALEYGVNPAVAASIGGDIRQWLEANSPYRNQNSSRCGEESHRSDCL